MLQTKLHVFLFVARFFIRTLRPLNFTQNDLNSTSDKNTNFNNRMWSRDFKFFSQYNGLVHYFQGSFRLCNRILRWLVRPKHFPDSETLPRIQKHFPESKTRPRIQKHFPESKNTSQNPKHFPEFKNTLQNPDSGMCFGFWDLFWILGNLFGFRDVVLDSGKCFGFWEVFVDSGTCLDSGKCFL